MVFSSPVFLFQFLPITLLLVLLAGNRRAQNTVLLIASLLFYFWGEGAFVLLMFGTALFNFLCGLAIERTRSPRFVLAIAVAANLATLIWFKYANLFAVSLNALLAHWELPSLVLDPIHLPIGVSFFIFHSLSYVIDVYRGDAKAQRSPGIATLYIALFPQLVAGPIIRYHDVAQQFTDRTVDMSGFSYGIRRFIIGVAKKVLIADQCARIVDSVFKEAPETVTMSVAWLGIVAYAVQIYFDFSGYSDMAIGLGRMLGFRFLENFNRPYIARSLREFWKRWHISLTNFFRDYLYIPLGGNRAGGARTYLNLLLVFFLTGLWHGASWNFVVWGMIHGFFMVLERLGLGKLLDRAPRLVGHVYTLVIVLTAWAFFRIENTAGAMRFAVAMWNPNAGDALLTYPSLYLSNATFLALAIGVLGSLNMHAWAGRVFKLPDFTSECPPRGVSAYVQLAGMILLFVGVAMQVASSTYSPFIYFRF
ncbi:MAG: MBOAT family protein [Flavobacteriales bacterium]|nr:MBOAT family protein [Flavobacteriales bacterium]